MKTDTKEGEGRNCTCGDAWSEKPGESGKVSGRLRIDRVEQVVFDITRIGDTMPFLKIDRVAIFCRKNCREKVVFGFWSNALTSKTEQSVVRLMSSLLCATRRNLQFQGEHTTSGRERMAGCYQLIIYLPTVFPGMRSRHWPVSLRSNWVFNDVCSSKWISANYLLELHLRHRKVRGRQL